jgi:hypothetical protein
MSQAEIDSFTLSEKTPSQFSEMLRQELNTCEEKCDQSYLFLTETRERLRLAQQLIQLQETSAQSLQVRIADLEQELLVKSEQLTQSNLDREDLRDRLKREKHNSYQLKTALERCLEPSVPCSPTAGAWALNQDSTQLVGSVISNDALHKKAVSNNSISGSKIQPTHQVGSTQDPDLAKPQTEMAIFASEVSIPGINVCEERTKLASIKLPQFPPMQRR